jgi:uncharacterized small protein (DUF1192 family)
MADPLSIVSEAIRTLQKLREVTQKMKHVELLNLVADLSLNLAELKLQVAELQEENGSLKAELKKNAQSSSFREKLVLKGSTYFFKEPQENRPDGPYCTRCYDVEEKLVLVTELERAFNPIAKYICPNCKAHYS